MVRRASAPNLWRIEHLLDRITLKPADLLDQLSLIRLIDEVRPHELYNLAAARTAYRRSSPTTSP
jgi:GDPmannose 4,6-dehydratase